MFFGKRSKKSTVIQCSMIVVAAGSSSRMGQDKMMMDLDGMPVLGRTLQALEWCPAVEEIIVVTREDLIPVIGSLCRDMGLLKVRKVVRGGADRVESARLGTLEVGGKARLIGIHDGARPFVSPELVEAVVNQAMKSGAAAPAVPVQDTIKVARNGIVEDTPDRSTLYAVQTPQIFDEALIRAALQKALDDHAPLTDDCSAVERLGMPVTLVEGDRQNIKLTTPADLALARVILEGEAVT